MLKCWKRKKDLVAFLSGELDGKRKERLTAHLETCSRCQKELEEFELFFQKTDSCREELNRAVNSVDWEALPSQIAEVIFQKEKAALPRPMRLRWQPVFAGILIGVMLGGLLMYFLFRSPFLERAEKEGIFASQEFLQRVELELARRQTLDYLEKSQYLLLELIQKPGKAPVFGESRFISEKAQELLTTKKYLNEQLNKQEMAKAKEICDQIEFLFYELAQVSQGLSEAQRKEIERLVEERHILLKIKLLKKELQGNEV